MTRQVLGRLHVITDEQVQDRFSHVELGRLAALGGADTIQHREKRPRTTRELLQTGHAMLEVIAGHACQLIVDDRADVAAHLGTGLHLGRDDLPPATARQLLPEAVIGGTANSLTEALAVAREPIDYLGVGPVYGTSTKANPAPTMGLETLAEIARQVPLPVIAIGSITAARIGEVMATGVHGVALVSAVVRAEDPAAATARCREAVDMALEVRK